MKYVIIGNGATAINAVLAIREHSREPVLVISKEESCAYSPMLIPHYVGGEIPYDALFLCNDTFYEENRVETRFGCAAVTLDPENKQVFLEDGSAFGYDRLLIATGSHPAVPPITGANLPGTYTVWTAEDAQRIKTALDKAKRVLVTGAGAIGMYMMDVLHNLHKQITVVEMEPRVMSAVLDEEAGSILEARMTRASIRLCLGMRLKGFESTKKGIVAILGNGEALEADMVIMATGVAPNTDIARGVLNMGRGIVVDEYCRTSVPDIYAAGDVTETGDPCSGKCQGNPTWINAAFQGRTAGKNMVGIQTCLPVRVRRNVFNVLGLTIAAIGSLPAKEVDCQRYAQREGSDYQGLYYLGDKLAAAILTGKFAADAGVLAQAMEKGLSCLAPNEHGLDLRILHDWPRLR